jgi:hypothetical protein
MPTIEERLAAITQTLELVAGMQLETEVKLGRLAELQIQTGVVMKAIAKGHHEHEKRINKLEKGKR